MLTDYDACAVAEVLGIGFLRDNAPPRVGAAAQTRRSGSRAGGHASDIVVQLGGMAVRVVGIDRRSPRAMEDAGHPGPEGRTQPPPSPALIEKAVAAGLPRTSLRHVAEWLADGDKAKASRLEWGVVPKTTLDRRERQLSPEESERTERVARLSVHARRALGTDAEAREFMTTPHPRLDGRSPVNAARTDFGTRRTEQILNALEYGLAP